VNLPPPQGTELLPEFAGVRLAEWGIVHRSRVQLALLPGVGGGAEAVPAPLREEELAALGRRPLAEAERERFPSCSVCLEEFQPGEVVVVPGCAASHPGHPACLRRWLGDHRGDCPVCREGASRRTVDGEGEGEV
jgi:hypothetical protein